MSSNSLPEAQNQRKSLPQWLTLLSIPSWMQLRSSIKSLRKHVGHVLPTSVRRPDNFLRSISLGVLGEYRQKGNEETKIILKHSFLTALSRCGVHLVPTAVSIILLIINFGGYFVGTELAGLRNRDGIKIAMLQVCAKVQELLIIASISTFLFHLIRVQLIVGEGLPLGLLSCGFSFTRVSYFWSPEFLGAVKHSPRPRWRKMAFITVLISAGMLALFAGPAAAVLMIPRMQYWPAGGTVFWMNGAHCVMPDEMYADSPAIGTQDDFWPDKLQVHPELAQACLQSANPYGSGCPADGFQSIYEFFVATQHPHSNPFSYTVTDGREGVGWIRTIDGQGDTWVVAPHASVGAIQDKLRSTWEQTAYQANFAGGKWYDGRTLGSHGIERFAYARDRTSSVISQNPAVRAVCSTRKELYWNSSMANSSTVPVNFPVLNNTAMWALEVVPKDCSINNRGPVLPYNAAPLFNRIVSRPGFNESIVNVQYTPLPTEFGDSSMGLLVAHSGWLKDQPNLWAVMGCSIDARWAAGPSQINDVFSGATWNTIWDKSDSIVTAAAYSATANSYDWMYYPGNRSTRSVKIDEDWFNLMAPVLPTSRLPLSRIYGQTQNLVHHNFSTIEWLLGNLDLVTELDAQLPKDPYSNAGLAQIFIESILAVLVADAMARVNVRFADFDGMTVIPNPANSRGLVRHGGPRVAIIPPTNHTKRNLVQLEMTQTISGYAYSVRTASDILAVIVLLVHMGFAIGHTVWTLWPWWCWKRESPGHWDTANAWDNVTDWITLCLTSPPPRPDILQNVGGGARKIQTMSKMAWISTSKEADASGVPRAQLEFRGEGIEKLIRRRAGFVEVGKEYA